MLPSFTQFQKLGQDNLDATVKAFGAFSKNAQAIAAESLDFAQKTFASNSAAVEKLVGAQSLDKAIEVQTAYVKGTYESLVGQSTKMGALYTALATDTFKPFEGLLSKAQSA
jgi:hypothetical protein